MKTIIKNKTKIAAICVALFAIVAIFVGAQISIEKAQACTTDCLPNVDGYCQANVSQANIGDTVTFTGYGQGGSGFYTYTWSGTDGLSGNTRTVNKSYSTSGTKTATVYITSNGQQVTRTCSVVIRQPVNNLNVTCYSSPSTANIGDNVTYYSNVSGGNGNYNYSWTGTDGLSGNSSSVSRSYSSGGTKSATVTVTSDGQSQSATCNTYINQQNYNNLSGYCEGRPYNARVNDQVTWAVYPSGGDGNYTYSWNGDESLYGSSQTIYKNYNYSGNKSATVTIYSNGQSITRTCNINIGNYNNSNLSAYCVANPSSAYINQTVTYTVYPSGGNSYDNSYDYYNYNYGNYYYSWSGTDGLYGNNSSVSKSYYNPGNKNATVTVSRGGQSVSATCYTNIMGNNYYPPYNPPPQGGVYLNTIPATGISPTVKTALFLSGTLLWSAFVGYMIIRRRNLKLAEQRMIDEAMNQ